MDWKAVKKMIEKSRSEFGHSFLPARVGQR